MPRKKIVIKKLTKQDPIYHSKLVTMIINKILVEGKKSIAQHIFYKSMEIIKSKTKKDPLEIIDRAFKNITPSVELKSKRVRGSVYSIPMEINQIRGTRIALCFLIKSCRERHKKSANNNFIKTFTNEILDASNNVGNSVKKKEDLHKAANANKAFKKFKLKQKTNK